MNMIIYNIGGGGCTPCTFHVLTPQKLSLRPRNSPPATITTITTTVAAPKTFYVFKRGS